MFLPALAVYNPTQPEYMVTPQIAPLQIVPLRKQRVLEGNLTIAMILNKCIREGIAIIGLFIAAFGLFGTFEHILNPGIALLLGLILLLGGITFVSIYLFAQKKFPRLRWSQILISGTLTTVAWVIMMLIVSAIVQSNVIGRDLGYGTIIFLYGLVLAALVVW